MKKTVFSVALIFAVNLVYSQITLEHSFANGEYVSAHTSENEMLYFTTTPDNKIKIYDANYSLQKTINVLVPANYNIFLSGYYDGTPYSISKHIFNTDDKFEFMVESNYYDNSTSIRKLLLINEDGTILKDFTPDITTKIYSGMYSVFHDSTINKNKLIVNYRTNDNIEQFDIFSLPTSELTSKEIISKNKLSAFPIPTSKILNVLNPKSGANKIEIFDTTGKLVLHKNFGNSESKVSVDVENLPKGIYVYKIGDLSSKFIKN